MMPNVNSEASSEIESALGMEQIAVFNPPTEQNEIAQIGQEMHRFIADLYPICRSITGDGVRETLKIISRHIPLTMHEVPSGTQVFDWTVPKEWNIRDAYVKNTKGERVIDFNRSNLHIVGYSIPMRAKMRLAELKEHLYTQPEQPDWIPQRNSYYKETWGFCLSHNELLQLKDEEYEVGIDSSLTQGYLTYGECFIQGQTTAEVLISCHVCHPSLCNDNLSGIALATFLAKQIFGRRPRYSYRFVFIPGTIGSITWLARNEANVSNIKHGLVVTCVGDAGHSTYKKSRRGDAEIDKAAAHVLKHSGQPYKLIEFSPYGYDERQYCSPGFNLPVGCLMRTLYGQFPEYHTSADNLDFVKPESLADSLTKAQAIFSILEHNKIYISLNPKCEPQLGKRGLYRMLSGGAKDFSNEMAMLWTLNMSDGNHTLLDIAERSGLAFSVIQRTATALVEHALLREYSSVS